MIAYLYLTASIILEVLSTLLLKKTEGFTNLIYTVLVLFLYSVAFYGLSISIKTLPVGVVYATWSGAGIILIAFISYFLYKESLDFPACLGIILILVGVFLLNIVSKTNPH